MLDGWVLVDCLEGDGEGGRVETVLLAPWLLPATREGTSAFKLRKKCDGAVSNRTKETFPIGSADTENSSVNHRSITSSGCVVSNTTIFLLDVIF